jgi:hypothetical protein
LITVPTTRVRAGHLRRSGSIVLCPHRIFQHAPVVPRRAGPSALATRDSARLWIREVMIMCPRLLATHGSEGLGVKNRKASLNAS